MVNWFSVFVQFCYRKIDVQCGIYHIAVYIKWPLAHTRIEGVYYSLSYNMIAMSAGQTRNYCRGIGQRVVYIDSLEKKVDIDEMQGNRVSIRLFWSRMGMVNWLFNVTINDISVVYVTTHRCAGGLKKWDLRSGSQRHRHFVEFSNVPV